jgi:endonuclease/exonuclease/phosphatase family metal-dependent hydrolase
MRLIVIIAIVLLICIFIPSSQSHPNIIAIGSQQSAMAYSLALEEDSMPLKPMSRGEESRPMQRLEELSLMTYNIHRGIGKNGALNLSATAEVINASNADIISLQEVERYSIRTGFVDQIKFLGTHTSMNYAYGKSINVLNGEYGNAILSKYPIEEYKAFPLPSIGEQRTVLRSVINVDGMRVAVYNTHLGLSEEERKSQLDFIIEMTLKEEHPFILMGDLNSSIERLKALTEIMTDSAENSDLQEQSTYVDDKLQERIDYIFTSQDITVEDYDVAIVDASDHYPVVCKVIIHSK